MSNSATASQRITDTVTSWPGVEAGPGRRGEFAFTVGGRQIGHLHGDRAAHFSFPLMSGRSCGTRDVSPSIRSSPASEAPRRAASRPTRTWTRSSRCCGSITSG